MKLIQIVISYTYLFYYTYCSRDFLNGNQTGLLSSQEKLKQFTKINNFLFNKLNKNSNEISKHNSYINDSSNASFELIQKENMCLFYYENLDFAYSEFFRCVLINSRPFQICRNCLQNYTQVIQARNLIDNVIVGL
mgnify:CR=1 FL=1